MTIKKSEINTYSMTLLEILHMEYKLGFKKFLLLSIIEKKKVLLQILKNTT